jgi:hypothetical protein
MLSTRGRLYLTIAAIVFVILISYLVLSKWEGNIAHIFSGLLLSWFLPGFSLMLVLYPAKLIRIHTLVFSVVISFLFDILIGAILEFLNFKLNESSFVIGLNLITISLLIASSITNTHGASSSSHATAKSIFQLIRYKIEKQLLSVRLVKSYYIVLFILISVLIITVWWAFRVNLEAATGGSKTFTALTIEPLSQDLLNNKYKVVIDNQENKSMDYRLELRRNSIILANWENIALDQNEQWAVELSSSQFIGQTDLWLFKEGEDQPYRQLQLVVQ